MSVSIDRTACELLPGDRGHYMRTYTGRKFWPMDPKAADMSIEDVAHHLAMQVRFNGAVKDFYSVAEHCVIGSYLVPPEDAFEFLMHDHAETWLGDLIRPMKNHSLLGDEYKRIEAAVEAVGRDKWGLQQKPPESVKHVDKLMCSMEIQQVYLNPVDEYVGEELMAQCFHEGGKLHFWGWREAERQFLRRFFEIAPEVTA